MEKRENFGRYIKEKRKEAGLSQKELATQLFVSESAVSKWERGLSYPDMTLVTSLCEILHVSEHELLTASDDMHQREIHGVFAAAGIFCKLFLKSLPLYSAI